MSENLKLEVWDAKYRRVFSCDLEQTPTRVTRRVTDDYEDAKTVYFEFLDERFPRKMEQHKRDVERFLAAFPDAEWCST